MRNQRKKSGDTSRIYLERVNRAIDFIVQQLDRPLPLEVVAKVAGFSPFHFHRIFRALVGESLNEFVKRVRLERALALLSRENWATRRKPTVTDIAFACGFTSSADFSRCFRQHYGAPPSRFDVDAFRAKRREAWQAATTTPAQRHRLDRLKPGANPDCFAVQLRRLPARCVAYVRVPDAYREGAVAHAATQLVEWAERRGVAGAQWLGYMWDDPEIVRPEHCRYDVGVEISAATPRDKIGRINFPAMLVAEVEVRGGIDLEMRALDWLFGTWLPASGYIPTEQPCFEAWIGRPFAHGTEHFELRIQIPIERG